MITKVQVIKYGEIEIDKSWYNMIKYVRENPHCEMTIRFKDGKPYEAVNIKESIRF